MKKIFLLLFVCVSFFATAQNTNNTTMSVTDFMKAAVLEGLQKNNFNPLHAKTIASDYSLYIGKCNICNGVRFAFDAYSKTAYNETTSYYAIAQLLDTSTDIKLKTLEKLVEEYVQAYYTNHAFTAEQKAAMQQQVEQESMRSKKMTNGKYCASCTGSCKKPE